MVALLGRVIDSLVLIINLVIEDLVWIKDYLQSVTNSECLFFFVIMFVYLYLYKFVMRNLSSILGYILSLLLMFITPKLFTMVAFDAGGAVSGPMTTSFLLPLIILKAYYPPMYCLAYGIVRNM